MPKHRLLHKFPKRKKVMESRSVFMSCSVTTVPNPFHTSGRSGGKKMMGMDQRGNWELGREKMSTLTLI